jgi:hypothetical protein
MLLRKSWDLSVRQQWLCHTERWILVDVSRSIKPRRYIGCYYRLAEKTFQEDRFVSSTVTRRDQPSATRYNFPAVHIWKLQNYHDVWPKARAV